jgi:hypothetical protein
MRRLPSKDREIRDTGLNLKPGQMKYKVYRVPGEVQVVKTPVTFFEGPVSGSIWEEDDTHLLPGRPGERDMQHSYPIPHY